VSTTRVNLDTTQYVRVTSDPLTPSSLLLQSHRDTVRIAFNTAKPATTNEVFHELGGEHPPLPVSMTEIAAWALGMTERSALTVTEQRLPIEISDRDTMGEAVFIQDQTTGVLSVPFLQDRVTLELAAATVVGSYEVEVVTGGGALVGEILELARAANGIFMQAMILAIAVGATDTITLDAPVNDVYATTDIVQTSTENLLVDGSTTEQVFSILPLPGQRGDMVRLITLIEGTDNMDYGTFGSDAGLARGCVVRVNNGDGTYRNLFNFRTNGDFALQGFDTVFHVPRQGNSTRGFSSRITWGGQSKHGVVIRLSGSLGERLEVVIQDNLTAGLNTKFKLLAEGHELQES